MLIKKIFLFFILITTTFPWPAQAVGVSVRPPSLDFLYPSPKEYSVIVKNISPEPIMIFAQTDDFVSNFHIEPRESSLLPDESIKIKIKPNFSSQDPGIKQTHLSVVSRAVDTRSFNAASGIKIPITVYISESFFSWSAPLVFLAIFFGLLIIAFGIQAVFEIIKHKRRKKRWFDINFLKHNKKFRLFRR